MSLELLVGATANGSGDWLISDGYQGLLRIAGDLGGGTIAIEILGQDGSVLALQDSAQTPINIFNALGAISVFSLPRGVQVRATLAGSTGANAFVSLD